MTRSQWPTLRPVADYETLRNCKQRELPAMALSRSRGQEHITVSQTPAPEGRCWRCLVHKPPAVQLLPRATQIRNKLIVGVACERAIGFRA